MSHRKYSEPHESRLRVEVFDLEEEEDLPEEAQVRQELGEHSPGHVMSLPFTASHQICRDVPVYYCCKLSRFSVPVGRLLSHLSKKLAFRCFRTRARSSRRTWGESKEVEGAGVRLTHKPL